MSLEPVLNPSSVAVVGASRNPTKRGFQAIRTLLQDNFEGSIYPVNPKEKSILGLKCYAKVSDIEGPVDLALITTPAGTIPAVLEDCGAKGVSGAVIIAGGFGEIGVEGRKLEETMVEAARKNHIRLIGPNTSGMMNLGSHMNLVGLRDTPQGDIALLTQSGNMALTLITEAKIKSRKGFSYYVGVGNEADIKFHEYLKYFRDDEATKAILMYVEGLRDGRTFLQEAYQTTLKKPIILLKSGRSATGKRSAGSHTGALAGMSAVAEGAFRRAGIITIEKSDELFPAAETLSSLPWLKNNRIAILADGGGHATIAADLLTEYGLEIPPLSEKTQEKLRKILPRNASVVNPVDVAGGTDADPTIFADCAEALLTDREIGGLLVVGLFGGYGIRFDESLAFAEEDASHRMGKLVKEKGKPIVIHSLYSFVRPHPLELLRYYDVPVYDSLDIACKCVSVLNEYGHYLQQHHSKAKFTMQWGKKAHQKSKEIIKTAYAENRTALLEHEAKEILREHGVAIAAEGLAKDAEEAVRFSHNIQGPVAMKIVSPDILHKSDAGGVKLNLVTDDDVKQAFEAILESARAYRSDADIRGVLVTPMIQPGVEVIIGTKIDDQFGPVVMCGLGGVHVEVLKDVVFRVLPISKVWAKRMPDELRSAKLLDGFRGKPPVDKAALIDLLVTVSEIVEAYPEIEEMDFNPVIVREVGLHIADARIILKQPG
jgi:acyl-CoA synthetase (NDP forming)